MGLRKADTTKTKRFEHPDGDGDWIELRLNLTLGERHRLTEASRNYVLGEEDGMEVRTRLAQHQRELFGILAVAWSMGDGRPSVEDYVALDEESGDWVDQCMEEVLAERAADARDRAEGKSKGSEKRSNSRTASRAAAE